MGIFITGLLMGLSLIIGIGPQNALIIKLGMRKQAIVPVILVCLISDILLIIGGTLGVGVIIATVPQVLTVLSIAGAAYLLWFAWTCFRDAARPQPTTIVVDTPAQPQPQGGVALATRQDTVVATRTWLKPVLMILAMTWLNPAAYVDTVVMLGGMANQYGSDGRWLFAGGALVASALWFPTIGWASVRCAHQLARPKVWQWMNIAVGCIMVLLALRLIAHI
ncbi:LysE/ArgO family amino acid transporter [Corynebacterium pseudopelargi]|nr:LysE/ArgO family amino acid transporter [Corynebacterium pseudopelargi]